MRRGARAARKSTLMRDPRCQPPVCCERFVRALKLTNAMGRGCAPARVGYMLHAHALMHMCMHMW